MRKKEEWMFKGAFVLANGERAVVTKIQENEALGLVYYFWVKKEGAKREIGPYHPSDIQPLP